MPLLLYQIPGDGHMESLSPLCVKVTRALNAKGLAFTARVPAGGLRPLGPNRHVPILQHGADRIAGSAAIVRYLDARLPGPTLTPDDAAEAAQARLLEDWSDASLYFLAQHLLWGVPEHAARLKARIKTLDAPARRALRFTRRRSAIRRRLAHQGVGRLPLDLTLAKLQRRLDDLDATLDAGSEGDGARFLVGAQLTAADLSAFAMLSSLATGLAPPAEALIRDRARVWSWLTRVDSMTRTRRALPSAAGDLQDA